MRAGLAVVFTVLMLGLLSCSGDPDDPEQQVRDTIAAAEQAGEDRDMSEIAALVHPDYQDRGGRNRAMLLDQVRLYLLVRQSLEMLVRIEDVNLTANDYAEVTVDITGLGIRSSGPVLSADADRFQVDLVLNDSGDWQLISARRLRE